MKDAPCLRRMFALHRTLRTAGAAICATLLLLALCQVKFASAEVPPSAVKKAVSLDASRMEAERIFAGTCAKCHAAPNPAQPVLERPDCTKGISEADRAQVRAYTTDVITGKGLYESRCGRCHKLIAPGSRTREYWSKNVCTSEECFIENLKKEEEQQVLLYLSSQANKN
jgi:mono/diheme cytochrome c family protein